MAKQNSDFWDKVDQSGGPDACWPWTLSLDSKGYGQLWENGRLRRAHQVAYERTNGPFKFNVLHDCDYRPCCNPAHLYDGTLKQNTQDMVRRGRAKYRTFQGSCHGMAILSDDQARFIKTASGIRQIDLAARFGVSKSTVAMIRTGKIWRHI
jgi:hypothetical protein